MQKINSFKSNIGRNLWLDIFRGCSALVVCLGHLRNAIMVDFSELVDPGIAIKAFYAMTSLGHQAVVVFFLLSGYFVGGAVLRSGVNFSWGSYLTSRLTRLWVVLIPCLIVTWLVDLIVEHYAPGVLSGANYDIWHSGPNQGEYSADLSTFFANVLFLQTIASPVFGTNGPLWSLANEFWYYMLFPMLAISIGMVGSGKYIFRAAMFILAVAIASWLPNDILYGFTIWIMGVAVYLLQQRIQTLSLTTARITLISGLLLFGLSLGYSKSVSLNKIFLIDPDLAVGLTFSILCLVLTYRPFLKMRQSRIVHFSRDLSEVSYSLYLSHFPIVVLIASTIYGSQRLLPNGMVLFQFFGWGIVLVISGSTIWWLFESRTMWVRNKITSSFSLLRI